MSKKHPQTNSGRGDNQVIAAKLLLEKAKSQMYRVGTEKAFAVLHAHDALDWVMQYLYEAEERKRSENTFKAFMKYIADHEKKFGYIDKTKCQQLDEIRNNFKHSFVLPNERQLHELIVWCEQQINSLLSNYVGKTLDEHDDLGVISLPDVKKQVEKARKFEAQNNKENALANLAIAFDMITRDVEKSIEEVSGKKPAISADFTFSNSFFMKTRELGDLIGKGREFESSWDNIIQSITELNAFSLINIIGLDLHDYYYFRSSTPKPKRAISGEYSVDIMPNLQKKIPDVDYGFCEDFVIQAAINASSILKSEQYESENEINDS